MQMIEQEGDHRVRHYRRALSQVLYGIEQCQRLSSEENTKYGEAITLLRTELGKFGDVDAFDDGSLGIPSGVKSLFEQYRKHANALAEGNIRLIYTAFQVSPTLWNLPDVELKDLAGTAQEELLRSAKRFNPWFDLQPGEVPYETRFPMQFSTYAVKNMRFRMMRAARESNYLHIPPQRIDQYQAYWGVRNLYTDQHQEMRFDTTVVMAEYKRTHEKYPTVEDLREYYNQVQKSEHALKAHNGLLRNYAKIILLLQPVSFEDMLTREKQYQNTDTDEIEEEDFNDASFPSADDVPEEVFGEIAREILTQVLDSVWPGVESGGRIEYPRARQILEMRYGLNGQKEHTLADIGRYFGFTGAGIQWAQESALEKLRHPSITIKLQDLLT
jgi:DNA-directed RNA polymerase sigma subunit (sigma70/sigma32)